MPGVWALGPDRHPCSLGVCGARAGKPGPRGHPGARLWAGLGGAALTGDVQVGVGLDLPTRVAGQALEDPRVLWTQLPDA